MCSSDLSANLAVLGAYFGGRLRSSVGISRDYFKQWVYKGTTTDAVTGEVKFVDLNGNAIDNRGLDRIDPPLIPYGAQWVTNQTYGAVWPKKTGSWMRVKMSTIC